MFDILPKLLGAAGLVCITYGIFLKREVRQDMVFALGGFLLLVYSISVKDPIFIPLQIVFTGASIYEIYAIRKKKKVHRANNQIIK